jgi:hypothetical protein
MRGSALIVGCAVSCGGWCSDPVGTGWQGLKLSAALLLNSGQNEVGNHTAAGDRFRFRVHRPIRREAGRFEF